MSDFGKEVAKEIRGLKEKFSERTIIDPHAGSPVGSVDRSVAEQVHADLDRLIEKHEKE